ncbi:MAG: holdfast anchoring protein HfaB [Pseudomonadota bacterium]|jgi:curli biogenesis system outer membrane secretion channel CsgG
MAISALSKAGVRLVERFDTSVAELELRYANNKLIGDEIDPDYRRILAGSIPGSDFYLVGGITELNFNIRSSGASLDGGGLSSTSTRGSLSGNAYVMNVGLDLRLVDTNTLEVVDVISYQKQIVARQIEAGVFDVLGTQIVTAGIGESALEPIQLAVRAVIERAVLEMVSRLYDVGPEGCRGNSSNDPLADSYDPAAHSQTHTAYAPEPAYAEPAYLPEPALPPAPPPPAYASEPPIPPAPPSYSDYPEYPEPQANGPVYSQPLPPPPAPAAYAPPPAYVSPNPPSYNTPSYTETSNEQTRQDPYRWYSAVDPDSSGLRGGLR